MITVHRAPRTAQQRRVRGTQGRHNFALWLASPTSHPWVGETRKGCDVPKVLLIEASSTEALPLEERCDAIWLPANVRKVMVAVSRMFAVDSSLRLVYPKWVSEGYLVPLNSPGCKAWVAEVDGRTARSWRRFWEVVQARRPGRIDDFTMLREGGNITEGVLVLLAGVAGEIAPVPSRPAERSLAAFA